MTLAASEAPQRRPGPRRCACGEIADTAYQRHATQAEYDAIPEHLRPIDGIALVAVHVCEDCEPPNICVHDTTVPPCPICGASGETPCTKANGSPKRRSHRDRPTSGEQIPCRNAHREDCPGAAGCLCTCADPAPSRIPRTIVPAPDSEAVKRAQAMLAEAERAYVADLMARYGGDKAAVAAHARTEWAEHIAAARQRLELPGTDAGGGEA